MTCVLMQPYSCKRYKYKRKPVLNDGILNLNGYKLSVGGNLIQSGGTMYINKGQLLVEGSYRIQSRNYQADGTFEYGDVMDIKNE